MPSPVQLVKKLVHALRSNTHQSTAIYVVYPAPAATTFAVTAAQVTSGASFAAYGTTDEIVSSVTNDCWIDGIFVTSVGTVGNTIEIDIGVGADGSETWLATIVVKLSALATADLEHFYPLAHPVYVPASGRIAQRATGEGATTVNTVLLCREGLKGAGL